MNLLYKKTYWDIIKKIKRLQVNYLQLMNEELYAKDIKNLSGEGAFILYNLNTQKLNVNELASKNYFIGTNPSYTLNKLEKNGYLMRVPDEEDKRAVYVQLTEKGMLTHLIIDQIIQNQSNLLEKIALEKNELSVFYRMLCQIENYWNSYLDGRI